MSPEGDCVHNSQTGQAAVDEEAGVPGIARHLPQCRAFATGQENWDVARMPGKIVGEQWERRSRGLRQVGCMPPASAETR